MVAEVDWSAEERVLRTRLAGVLQREEVYTWQRRLESAAGQIPSGEPFFMLVDISGYEVGEQALDVHKAQREVIPIFLARHGFEVGFFRLMDVQNTIPPDPERGRCLAVVHVHHDCTKMERYRELLGSDREQFFCERSAAEGWLRNTAAVVLGARTVTLACDSS